MSKSDAPMSRGQTLTLFWRLSVALGVLTFTLIMTRIALTPRLLSRIYASDEDYSRVSEIGQAYGAASAVISALALAVVVIGLVVKSRQFRRERLRDLREDTKGLVLLAVEDPQYRQCWGSRVGPPDIDEGLFYYCNLVLSTWKQAWDLRDLTEEQARSYLAKFFDSQIPREFWRKNCPLNLQVKASGRRRRFLAIVNEEYLRATTTGLPRRSPISGVSGSNYPARAPVSSPGGGGLGFWRVVRESEGVNAEPQDHERLLTDLYAAFNRRDVDGVLAKLTDDVVWPNGWAGGTILGHDQVREYWHKQWSQISPTVEPVKFADQGDGRTAVTVHQVVRDRGGKVVADEQVEHIYRFVHGLVSDMEIRKP